MRSGEDRRYSPLSMKITEKYVYIGEIVLWELLPDKFVWPSTRS